MNVKQLLILIVVLAIQYTVFGLFSKNNPAGVNEYVTYNDNISNIKTPAVSKRNFPKEVKIFFILLSVFPLLIGLWAVNTWLKEYNLAKDSLNWPKYEGKMLKKHFGGNYYSSQKEHRVAGNTYCPEVEYEFNYKGQNIQWHEIDFSNRVCSGDKNKAQSVLDALPEPGEKIDVYFSIEKRRAVLIPGVLNNNYFGISVGMFFLSIGVFFVWFAFS